MAFERILVVDDERIIRRSLQILLHRLGYAVATAENLADARGLLGGDTIDLVFLDQRLPDGDGLDLLKEIHERPEKPMVVLMTGFATVESAVESMRFGAFDYIIKPFSNSQIEITVRKAEEYEHIVKVARHLNRTEDDEAKMVGQCDAFSAVRELIDQVAPTDATVLINGESGTGKELVAAAIHRASSRAEEPFIKVNCAAISESLIESEFFGHEKGAFTGATQRREGRFELASNGSILLDEISEIPPPLQAKLLRVLQEREFERVGGNKTLSCDVRVIATTNRDLEASVERGEFREDLFYRLNVFPIRNPPLRERRTDIPLLVNHFVKRFSRKHGVPLKSLSSDAHAALVAHEWPGNVRELQNSVERAVILSSRKQVIDRNDFGLPPAATDAPPESEVNGPIDTPAPPEAASLPLVPLEEVERNHILATLKATDGNRTHASRILGIGLRTLRNKIRQYRDDGYAVPE